MGSCANVVRKSRINVDPNIFKHNFKLLEL